MTETEAIITLIIGAIGGFCAVFLFTMMLAKVAKYGDEVISEQQAEQNSRPLTTAVSPSVKPYER